MKKWTRSKIEPIGLTIWIQWVPNVCIKSLFVVESSFLVSQHNPVNIQNTAKFDFTTSMTNNFANKLQIK